MRGAGRLILFLLMCSPGLQADTRIVTDTLDLAFNAEGSLNSATACYPALGAVEASCMRFAESALVRLVGGGPDWIETSNQTDSQFELRFESPSGEAITWVIPLEGYLLNLSVTGVRAIELASGTDFRPREAAGFGNWLEQSRYLGITDGEVTQLGLDDEETHSLEVNGWAGYRNRFWALLAETGGPVTAGLSSSVQNRDARLQWPLSPGSEQGISVYLGPVEPRALAAADPDLDEILYAGLWFWLRWICFALYYLLLGISLLVPSWGLSVMVMSLVVHVLMLPLSRIADRFQQQVHATEARLAPELGRIKREYRGEEQSAKILALYKTERVHPLYSLKSLLGVAVVIPIFIGAFDMLAENIHLLNASFLWIADLSRPDDIFDLPFSIPFFGSAVNLLPLLMTGLSVSASALHNPPALHPDLRRKQLRNMLLMALGFFALFYTFPAGMVLYWTTNNLISVIKSLWARR
jgi:YidC/Oxa1 family membrane protein insertase